MRLCVCVYSHVSAMCVHACVCTVRSQPCACACTVRSQPCASVCVSVSSQVSAVCVCVSVSVSSQVSAVCACVRACVRVLLCVSVRARAALPMPQAQHRAGRLRTGRGSVPAACAHPSSMAPASSTTPRAPSPSRWLHRAPDTPPTIPVGTSTRRHKVGSIQDPCPVPVLHPPRLPRPP